MPPLERFTDELLGAVDAANQLDDNVDVIVLNQIVEPVRGYVRGQFDIAFLGQITNNDSANIEVSPGSFAQQFAVANKVLVNPGANIAEAS